MNAADVEEEFRAFVAAPGFPCLAGRGLVRQGGYALGVYPSLGSAGAAEALARDLGAFASAPPPEDGRFSAFVAVFGGRAPEDEVDFERRLWRQLQALHDLDGASPWDAAVSADPEAGDFAFSFAGHAFFIVGLHPHSGRLARRFAHPTLVFNPHAQFDRLRADGRFERLRSEIRERDVALQGSPNPTLADFGTHSEARQYSGRATEPEWRCPFHPRDP